MVARRRRGRRYRRGNFFSWLSWDADDAPSFVRTVSLSCRRRHRRHRVGHLGLHHAYVYMCHIYSVLCGRMTHDIQIRPCSSHLSASGRGQVRLFLHMHVVLACDGIYSPESLVPAVTVWEYARRVALKATYVTSGRRLLSTSPPAKTARPYPSFYKQMWSWPT